MLGPMYTVCEPSKLARAMRNEYRCTVREGGISERARVSSGAYHACAECSAALHFSRYTPTPPAAHANDKGSADKGVAAPTRGPYRKHVALSALTSTGDEPFPGVHSHTIRALHGERTLRSCVASRLHEVERRTPAIDHLGKLARVPSGIRAFGISFTQDSYKSHGQERLDVVCK